MMYVTAQANGTSTEKHHRFQFGLTWPRYDLTNQTNTDQEWPKRLKFSPAAATERVVRIAQFQKLRLLVKELKLELECA